MTISRFKAAVITALVVVASACGGGMDAGGDVSNNSRGAEAHSEAAVRYGSRVHKMPKATQSVTNTATTAHLQYYGGHVISNVKVYAINWGGGVNSTIQNQIPNFYTQFTQSPMFDWLSEYNTNITAVGGQQGTNQIIGHGTYAGEITITPSVTSSTVDDTQIQSELNAQITSGKLPAPDANTIYMVNFPKGITITQGGSSSCQAFCAYHGTFTRSSQSVYYGVLPSLESGTGCDTGCGSASTMFANATSVASHELIEAVTDAEVGLSQSYGPPLAWYDQTNGEIGDICNAQQGSFVGNDGVTYTVQKEWDNASNACITSKSTTSNDFSVALGSSSATVTQGSSTTVTVNTSVISGSAQSVSLSVSGLPSGVTGSFSPSSVTAGGSSTLTLTASSTATTGSATFTVKGTATSGSHSASGSLTVNSSGGGGGGGGGALTNGVPVNNLSGATGAQLNYTLAVPSGASNLVFTIAGGTGDADLYVKFGSAPTLSSYDCRPYITGNNETCTITNIQAGTYYVMLNGYAAFSGVTLTGSYSTTTQTNDFSIALGSSSASVTQGSSTSVTVNTAVSSGSAQTVSLSVSGLPSGVTGSFSPASVTAGGSSTLTLTASSTATTGTATFTVKGTATSGSHSASGSLTVNSSGGGGGGGGGTLSNGVAVTNLSGATGSQQNFTMVVPSGATSLSFSISGGSGDADLYVKFGSAPTLSSYDCRPYVTGNNETCTISNIQAGTYYVMLNGYAAYSGVSLVGSYSTGSTGGGNVLVNGVPVTLSGASGSNTNYTFPVTSPSGSVTIKISGGSGDADLYVKFGSAPTTSSYDCRPYVNGNNETCTLTGQSGTYYVMVHGYQSYSGVSLVGSY